MAQYSISTLVKLPFERALRETHQALKEEGFIIITEIDLQAQLAVRLKQQIRPYTILGVWVPSWEYEAMSREPDIGLLMPATFVCGTTGMAPARWPLRTSNTSATRRRIHPWLMRPGPSTPGCGQRWHPCNSPG